jgi:hypothetical protein
MIGTHKGPSGGCPSRPAEEGDRVLDAAVVVEDDMPNASVDLFVDAGIAAADAICVPDWEDMRRVTITMKRSLY